MPVALIVVDMIKDNMSRKLLGLEEVIQRIKRVIEAARRQKVPIIYANDSFMPFDSFFEYMPKHAIRGTKGVEVIEELNPKPEEWKSVLNFSLKIKK